MKGVSAQIIAIGGVPMGSGNTLLAVVSHALHQTPATCDDAALVNANVEQI